MHSGSDILGALVLDNQPMNEDSLGLLEAYCREHPYCQTAHMLRIGNLKVLGRLTDNLLREGFFLVSHPARLQAWLNTLENSRPDKAHKEAVLDRGIRILDDPSDERHAKQRELIERFLQSEPRIQPKKELLSSENIAADSLKDQADLVSETLADVLHKQGNSRKAMEIYQKLCLIYPEKSSYFAKKLQAIKNESKLDD